MDKTNKLLILWSIHIGSMHEIAKSLKFSTLMGHYIEPKLSFCHPSVTLYAEFRGI